MKMRVQIDASKVPTDQPSWTSGRDVKVVIVIQGTRGEPIVGALVEARKHVETTLRESGLR